MTEQSYVIHLDPAPCPVRPHMQNMFCNFVTEITL